jgi:transcriptional regulator with XRE-family HTH domain
MTTTAGYGLATIAEYPTAADHRKDGPADPARLNALVALAGRNGLARFELAMPRQPSRPCERCDHETLCAARGRAGLWAPCETPYQSDLVTLANLLEESMSENGNKPKLHEWLRARREELGLEVADLARASGIAAQAIREVEAGKTLPLQRSLIALAYGLETDPKHILDAVERTPALRTRFASMLEIEYSGAFELRVTVRVEGENRRATVRQVDQALREVGKHIAAEPASMPLPAAVVVCQNGDGFAVEYEEVEMG